MEEEVVYPRWYGYNTLEAFEVKQQACFEYMRDHCNFQEGDTRYADPIEANGKFWLIVDSPCCVALFTEQELAETISTEELVAMRDNPI